MSGGRRRGFSLIEVVAVLLVAGLMSGLAAVSLRGVTRAETLEDAAERLRLLDERVRTLAEREHRVWRLRMSPEGASALPLDGDDASVVLQVRLGDPIRLEAWHAVGGAGEESVEVLVDAEGASPDYGWSLQRTGSRSDGGAPAARLGRFAGRTGQFSAGPQIDTPLSRGSRR